MKKKTCRFKIRNKEKFRIKRLKKLIKKINTDNYFEVFDDKGTLEVYMMSQPTPSEVISFCYGWEKLFEDPKNVNFNLIR